MGPLAQALGREPKERWLNRKEAARYLNDIGCCVSVKTLSNMASNNNKDKRGPPFSRFGWRTVRYAVSDLREWASRAVQRVE